MPTTLQAALLGIVQGLTEFLPVSSSAHLILARALFGFDADKFGLSFDVACHVGTLVAVLIYFREEVRQMVGAAMPVAASSINQGAHLLRLILIGTLPAAIVGIIFNESIEAHLRTPFVAAVALALGALALFAAERLGTKDRSGDTLTPLDALWIGCAQAAALIPGVSRSGVTITVALLIGLRRTDAARFVFLLAIPAIIAAAGSEGVHVWRAGVTPELGVLFAIGITTSAIVGYYAVKSFISYFSRHSLDLFAWYRLAVACSVMIWLSRA
jgi:undecaprenyl-diphosphatase